MNRLRLRAFFRSTDGIGYLLLEPQQGVDERRTIGGKPAPRAGSKTVGGGNPPIGVYPCKGGGPNDYCFIYSSRATNRHWERLLDLAQRRGVSLGMTFLDGTTIRAHPKAAGAEKNDIGVNFKRLPAMPR